MIYRLNPNQHIQNNASNNWRTYYFQVHLKVTKIDGILSHRLTFQQITKGFKLYRVRCLITMELKKKKTKQFQNIPRNILKLGNTFLVYFIRWLILCVNVTG